MEAGVNITVVLSDIGVSVDHGTAFDLPGKTIADLRSKVGHSNRQRKWPADRQWLYIRTYWEVIS